jgi:hypothetical protein
MQSPPQAPVVSANANTGPDLAGLSREVRRWIARHRKAPSSFQEFASSAGVPIPPPPAGKKYELTRQMQVILVNR